jgi:multidrug resistance protein, MATE family
MRRWRLFWQGEGGAGEVVRVAYPLVLSHLSLTLQVFVDRLFLTWYSAEAVAGAFTGMLATLAFIGVFTATGEYLTTFVAQYVGAGRPERIGPAVWQGIYFSMGAGLVLWALRPLAGPFFALAGHDPALQRHEVDYAAALLQGGCAAVLMATLSSFFAGRGATRVVLAANVAALLVNCLLDYLWIFGRGGFPEWGVRGAAWATVASQVTGALLFLAVILKREFRVTYHTLRGWRFDPALFARLLRYGLPTGLQYSLEIFAFALFTLILGHVGVAPLAATSLAFNLNMIVFMPMLGLGVGVSSMVGRYLGGDRPALAERTTWSAFWLSLLYMLACGALYLLAPRMLLMPYGAHADPAQFGEVREIAVVLLRFVAVYSIFDMMNVVFASALRGAGDTRVPMAATVVLSWVAMLLPAYVGCVLLGHGVYFAWCTVTAYVLVLGLTMFARFRAGGWRHLRVIEPAVLPRTPLAAAQCP